MAKGKGFDDDAFNFENITGSGKDKPEKKDQDAPAKPGKKMGRPKAKHGRQRHTLILEPEYLQKVRVLSALLGVDQSDIMNEALKQYLDRYERQNGPIPG